MLNRNAFSPAMAAAAVVVPLLLSGAAPQRTYLDDILDRAALYVLRYEKECSAVVAEEHYTQRLAFGCRIGDTGVVGDAHPADDRRMWDNAPTSARERGPIGPTRRELVSDVLMVQLADQTWAGFRDVATVDGRAVRDRAERLQSLFLSSMATLGKVQEESARYNLGDIRRTMNLPTFAMAYLHPGLRGRFSFDRMDDEVVDGIRAIVVAFSERHRPTIITNERGRDVVSTGKFWIDPATGGVLRSHLVAGDAASDARVESVVRYSRHAEWGFLLPAEMDETYDQPARPDRFCVTGVARYSNFRRFEVSVDEKVKVPK